MKVFNVLIMSLMSNNVFCRLANGYNILRHYHDAKSFVWFLFFGFIVTIHFSTLI